MPRCFWCNTDPVEAAQRFEGPHATWCVHFREEQRGGRVPKTDEEWDNAVSDEAVRQILATPDADVLAGKWPPLVESATRADEDLPKSEAE